MVKKYTKILDLIDFVNELQPGSLQSVKHTFDSMGCHWIITKIIDFTTGIICKRYCKKLFVMEYL